MYVPQEDQKMLLKAGYQYGPPPRVPKDSGGLGHPQKETL